MATKKKTSSEKLPEPSETQLQIFERASRLFHARQYREAKEIFALSAVGGLRELAHNSRLHIIMCDRRLGQPAIQLTTLEDHYNYAIERLNARDLDVARKVLDRAIEMTRSDGDKADHVYYAMAACFAAGGDARGAYENLKRAIEIDPRNRMAARQDPDFSGTAQVQPLYQLLFPERASSPF